MASGPSGSEPGPRCGAAAACGALLIALAACDPYPRDAEGTYEGVVDRGAMRVGVLDAPPWTVEGTGPEGPQGIEPDLVRDLAARLGVGVEWFAASPQEVLPALAAWRLDLVIGGLTQDDPWSQEVAFTRPYAERRLVVAGPTPGRFDDLDDLPVAAPPGSALAAAVRRAGGEPVPPGTPGVALAAKPAEALRPDEFENMTLETEAHVLAAPPGENRWLLTVERFIADLDRRARPEPGA